MLPDKEFVGESIFEDRLNDNAALDKLLNDVFLATDIEFPLLFLDSGRLENRDSLSTGDRALACSRSFSITRKGFVD